MAHWDGRFRTRLHPLALKFSSSLNVDQRLYREDIEGSLAHVEMLARQKIVTVREAKKIQRALREIQREIETKKFPLDGEMGGNKRFIAEDIHMAIENRLMQKLGEVGGKVHTARSRNDQIALDERLFLRKSIKSITELIRRFQKVCLAKAEQYDDVVMPGYTHLQRAQPILLAHHLLAYVSMLERDAERFRDCLKRVDRSPLGAAALAGTSLPIDRMFTARKLGFNAIEENSMVAVGDRDVHIEFLSACAIVMMHLSRCAEEFVLWSSQEWNFIEIGDAFTTGSSIMPQKKNPDMAELIRGKTGRVYGDLLALLTTMKGLPMSYNRDLQEDKHALFDASDTTADCLTIFTLMLKTVRFNRNRFEQETSDDFLLATELADYLVRKGMPFRKAHSIVGSIVRLCISKRLSLKKLALKDYQRFSKSFQNDVYHLLDARASISQKRSAGSTSHKEVRRAILRWRKVLT